MGSSTVPSHSNFALRDDRSDVPYADRVIGRHLLGRGRFPHTLDEIEHLAADREIELRYGAGRVIACLDPAPALFGRHVEEMQAKRQASFARERGVAGPRSPG